jgi:hypothetical protein
LGSAASTILSEVNGMGSKDELIDSICKLLL